MPEIFHHDPQPGELWHIVNPFWWHSGNDIPEHCVILRIDKRPDGDHQIHILSALGEESVPIWVFNKDAYKISQE